MMKRGVMLFVLACASAPFAVRAQATKTAEASAKAPETVAPPTLWSASELKWVDNPAVKGARHALLWGDPEKEAFGKLNRWPAGTEVPLHLHPFEVRGVVLEGTVTITPEGGAAKELGPGSYWHLPGKVKHVTRCKPGADCVFLTTSRLRYETRMASATK
jgi:quercetin dioxygenase-like cupin family protein